VAIWDRYLAYAVALDLAPAAVRSLVLQFRTTPSASDWRTISRMIRATRRPRPS
jgi:hypothetical protein